MNISFANCSISFRPWRPELGRVFDDIYAFDSETARIDEERPWLVPAYVLGAACDGREGYFLTRDHVEDFFAQHRDVPVVMHHAPFDLAVLDMLASEIDIYDWVDADIVWDTRLLHRLLILGTEGHTARGKGLATLDRCSEEYLQVALPKKVVDSQGDDVRLSYGKWLGRLPQEIEPVYLDYLAKDVVATLLVYRQLRRRLDALKNECWEAFGYVDDDWLKRQWRHWGPQTHHIQLKAAVVLDRVTSHGLHIDRRYCESLAKETKRLLEGTRATLRRYGYLPGERGCQKALQEILARIERQHDHVSLSRTDTGKITTKAEDLEPLADVDEFVHAYLEHQRLEKLHSTFLTKMSVSRVHPSFEPLVVTGRTASFGKLNAQNLPRDPRIRRCFVPRGGSVLLDADYVTLELAALSQAILTQFHMHSAMADAINAKEDLHQLVAANLTGKELSAVSKEERRKAKVVNFGKPGGMGDPTLQRFACTSYGMALSDDEVRRLTEAWFDLFPEMRTFLGDQSDRGHHIAWLFGLTPAAFHDHTGSKRFQGFAGGSEQIDEPCKALGWMLWKTMGESNPTTRQGRPYSDAEIDFFWTKAAEHANMLLTKYQKQITSRTPGPRLRWAVADLADRGSCITATGRLRAAASYCARHNTLFQGLAADGAKLALWQLWRAGYRIVNFIHDEVLIELPEDDDLDWHARRVRDLMIAGMKEVIPDLRIDVEYAVSRRWHKDAKRVYDEQGRLIPWEPSPSDDAPQKPLVAASAA